MPQNKQTAKSGDLYVSTIKKPGAETRKHRLSGGALLRVSNGFLTQRRDMM